MNKKLISFNYSFKYGRTFIKEEIVEFCEISKNGVWAYTSKGRKRVFNILCDAPLGA